MNPMVDAYLIESVRSRKLLDALRTIILRHGLTEQLKWGQPCYTFQGGNVVMLGSLKDHCVLSFPKGAQLKDPHGILTRPGENTQAARVIRFNDCTCGFSKKMPACDGSHKFLREDGMSPE